MSSLIYPGFCRTKRKQYALLRVLPVGGRFGIVMARTVVRCIQLWNSSSSRWPAFSVPSVRLRPVSFLPLSVAISRLRGMCNSKWSWPVSRAGPRNKLLCPCRLLVVRCLPPRSYAGAPGGAGASLSGRPCFGNRCWPGSRHSPFYPPPSPPSFASLAPGSKLRTAILRSVCSTAFLDSANHRQISPSLKPSHTTWIWSNQPVLRHNRVTPKQGGFRSWTGIFTNKWPSFATA